MAGKRKRIPKGFEKIKVGTKFKGIKVKPKSRNDDFAGFVKAQMKQYGKD